MKRFVMKRHAEYLSMAWFKFLTNYLLWGGAFLTFAAGALSLMGYHSGTLSGIDDLLTLNRIYGIFAILFSGYVIYVRFSLVRFKPAAPVQLYFVYIGNIVLGLFYNLGLVCVLETEGVVLLAVPFLFEGIISATLLICNYFYFKKRARLFKNNG